jgi:hypothetical protein
MSKNSLLSITGGGTACPQSQVEEQVDLKHRGRTMGSKHRAKNSVFSYMGGRIACFKPHVERTACSQTWVEHSLFKHEWKNSLGEEQPGAKNIVFSNMG